MKKYLHLLFLNSVLCLAASLHAGTFTGTSYFHGRIYAYDDVYFYDPVRFTSDAPSFYQGLRVYDNDNSYSNAVINYRIESTLASGGIEDVDPSFLIINPAQDSVTDASRGIMLDGETGSVGIGMTPDDRFTLSVVGDTAFDGELRAESVIVKSDIWADYVFEDGYDLRPLSSVEAYIEENGHLPGIPSQSEVIENGIDMQKMQVLMMEKIEELTLHMIELEKENRALKEQFNSLR